MKLKDCFGKIVENKKNKQNVTNFKKGVLKKIGKTPEELFDMEIDFKLKKLLED